jgi:uncharacterized protein (DUF1800 family)
MRRLTPAFTFSAAVAVAALASVQSVQGAVHFAATAVRQLTGREQAVHVLNRLAFGPRPGDVDRVARMGVDKWIALQLQPDRIPDPECERLLAAYPSLGLSASELVQTYPPPQQIRAALRGDNMTRRDSQELRRTQQANRAFAGEILSARVARAVVCERQLQEVMTDFWHNHFTVFIGKGPQLRYYIPEYDRDVIRPRAMGNFRELLGAVAHSPAMLIYLDNAQSVADSGRPTLAAGRGRGGRGRFDPRAPGRAGRRLPPETRERMEALMQQAQQRRPRGLNENYARELLELHTLGVDGGYTQQDVIEVARALTGWAIQPPRSGRSGFLFRPDAHDAGEKRVLGHRLPAGRGVEDGESVLDIVARHPSTARHIARKLAIRFVGDDPPADLVERAAAVFTRTNGNIREVVRTIVTSDEFFARAAFRSKVKSPFEVTVSALRALGAAPDTTPRTAGVVAFLGQPIYGHQAPDGWPETGEAWMNTGAILNRINFGLALAAGRLPGVSLRTWPAFEQLARQPRAAQVDGVIDALLGGYASPDTREVLASGNNPLRSRAGADSSATSFDDTGVDNGMRGTGPGTRRPARPGQAMRGGFGPVPALSGLAQVVGLALGSPEFQRR